MITRISAILLFNFFLINCKSSAEISAFDPTEVTDLTAIPNPIAETDNSLNSIMTTPPPEAIPQLPGIEIFSFGGDEPEWYTVDDDVMGGISNSTVEIEQPDILLFSGTMSLDNNGGFSSVRSDWEPINLSDYDGVLIRLFGDGKIYRLRIRSATAGSEIAYNAYFETNPNEWGLVYVPFKDMVPKFRGIVMDVDTLDTTSIGSFGFMLSDKQPGEFRLMIDWI